MRAKRSKSSDAFLNQLLGTMPALGDAKDGGKRQFSMVGVLTRSFAE